MEPQIYTTSIYGRIGYGVMCFPAALFALMFAVVAKEAINGTYKGSAGLAIFISALGVFCFCMLIHCIYQLFKLTPRLASNSECLIYRGILGKKTFKWEDIKQVSLCFAAGPFVYVFLFTKNRRRSYRLDVSGLNPDYRALYCNIKERIKQDDELDRKWFTWSWNKSVKEPSNTQRQTDKPLR